MTTAVEEWQVAQIAEILNFFEEKWGLKYKNAKQLKFEIEETKNEKQV